jgi:hypothetical protein
MALLRGASIPGIRSEINSEMRKLQILLFLAVLSIPCASAQKIKTGYDKAADFSKYKSFSLREPTRTPNRPILYASVMGTITDDLKAKGLTHLDKGSDLIVVPTGGLGYDVASIPGVLSDSCAECQPPAADAQWVGFQALNQVSSGGGSSGKPMAQGTLELDFVDHATDKVVWTGRVVQKFNPDKKDKALQQIAAAINKLLAEYPPKK